MGTNNIDRNMVNIKQASKILGVGKTWFYMLRKDPLFPIPALQYAKQVLFYREEINEYANLYAKNKKNHYLLYKRVIK